MTNREFLTKIASIDTIDLTEEVKTELMEHAQSQIDKLDAANANRKNKPSKKALENAPLVEKIYNEILSTEVALTASEVAAAMGEMSVQKASSLLRSLENQGKALKGEKTVKGKGKQKTYTKIEGVVAAEPETAADADTDTDF